MLLRRHTVLLRKKGTMKFAVDEKWILVGDYGQNYMSKQRLVGLVDDFSNAN